MVSTVELPVDSDPWYTSPQAARYIGIQPGTLDTWRASGKGPEYVKLGQSKRSRIRYRKSALDRYLNDRARGGND